MKLSAEGYEFIKRWEGVRNEAYLDSAGIPTIGIGFTTLNGKPVELGMTLSDEDIHEEFLKQVKDYEGSVLISVDVELSQNQLDALVSFCYNVGVPSFCGSTLLSLLNQGKYERVPEQFARWNKVYNKDEGLFLPLEGLAARRYEEAATFMGWKSRIVR